MEKLRLVRILCAAMGVTWVPMGPSLAATLDLAQFRGRVVYLDFWASWCAPCRESFPWMERLGHTYESRGLTIIAINLDHDRTDAEAFLARFHPNFQVVLDPAGVWAERYHVQVMPTSVLLDRKGNQRFEHAGFKMTDGKIYDDQVRELLGEQ